jgi:hypothetical protein
LYKKSPGRRLRDKSIILDCKPLRGELNCVGCVLVYVVVWFYVRWVPCHHGMARPQVADGGDALQLWREAANILN